MAFLSTYFADDYDAMSTYFGKYLHTAYKYVLATDSQTEILKINPAGWDRLAINYQRDVNYYSILRSFTLSLRFQLKEYAGGRLILNEYEANGLNALINVEIYELDTNTGDYELIYNGILDFKPETFSIDYKENFAEISIIDGSKENKFVTRDEIPYNIKSLISTDGAAVSDFTNKPEITLTPVNVILKSEQVCKMDKYLDDSGTPQYVTLSAGSPSELITRELVSNTVSIGTNEIGGRLKSEIDTYNDIVYKNETAFNVELTLTDLETLSSTMFVNILHQNSYSFSATNIELGVNAYDAEGVLIVDQCIILDSVYLERSGYIYPHERVDIPFDATSHEGDTITLPPDGYIKLGIFVSPLLVGSWSNAIVALPVIYFTELVPPTEHKMNFNFNENVIPVPATQTGGFFVHEAFTRLIQLITSETDTTKLFYSEVLGRTVSEFQSYARNGDAGLDYITNGYAIRNFDKPINISLRSLFKSFNAIYNLGLGYDKVNDRFYVDYKKAFYDDTYFMFELGDVSEFTRKPYDKAYFNDILAGYPEVEYEEIGGAKEYNTKASYSLNYPIDSKLDIRSELYADSVGIEIARRKQNTYYESEDTKYDELNFVIRTDGTKTVVNGSSITGFNGVDSYYNGDLTPRKNLVRHANWFLPAMQFNFQDVKFVSRQKNIDLIYLTTDGAKTENQDIASQYEFETNKLFIPEIYTFKHPVTRAMLNTLNTNPHGFVRFAYNGGDYAGYIDMLEITDYPREAEWTLIGKQVTRGFDLVTETTGENIEIETSTTVIGAEG